MAEREMDPTPGAATETALPQQRMVVPAEVEEPRESAEDGKTGGKIYTCAFYDAETRPQALKKLKYALT